MVTQVIVLYIDSSPYCYWYSDLVTSALEENKRLADSLAQEKRERSQGSVLHVHLLYTLCVVM